MLTLIFIILLAIAILAFWISDSVFNELAEKLTYVIGLVALAIVMIVGILIIAFTAEIATAGNIDVKINKYASIKNTLEEEKYMNLSQSLIYRDAVSRINELEEEKVDIETSKWLLYFGGDND